MLITRLTFSSALILSVLLPAIMFSFLSGTNPLESEMSGVQKFLSTICFGKWAVEIGSLQELESLGSAHFFEIPEIVGFLKRFGYSQSRVNYNFAILIALGLFWRICSFIALWFAANDRIVKTKISQFRISYFISKILNISVRQK